LETRKGQYSWLKKLLCAGQVNPSVVNNQFLTFAEDNYGTLLAYFTRQNGVDPEEVRRYLGIDAEYEDIC